jgi:hypothetical protein
MMSANGEGVSPLKTPHSISCRDPSPMATACSRGREASAHLRGQVGMTRCRCSEQSALRPIYRFYESWKSVYELSRIRRLTTAQPSQFGSLNLFTPLRLRGDKPRIRLGIADDAAVEQFPGLRLLVVGTDAVK